MYELARTDDGITFYKLEHAFELDKLNIGEFSYFRKYLGMADYLANFKSWIKRPAVVLILAISDNRVVGWTMNEKWSFSSSDGKLVYVLRGIEVSPQFARRGLGRNMFFLVSSVLVGHIVTKPVNKAARSFFESLFFTAPSCHSPVNLGDYPGYLIFEEKNKSSLSCGRMVLCDKAISKCRMKLFPGHLLEDDTQRVNNIKCSDGIVTENEKDMLKEKSPPKEAASVIKEEKNSLDTVSRPVNSHKSETLCSQENFIFDGKFIGEQKMMSACKCGHYYVHKYQVTGNLKGTAFICTKCYIKRYFLPLK